MRGSAARNAVARPSRQMTELRRLALRFAGMLPFGGDVLDVLPDGGTLALELAREGRFRVTGLDSNSQSLDKSRRSAEKLGLPVTFQYGKPESMPFPDGSFDLLVCRAPLRELTDPVGTLREMRRVLKPGRQGVILNTRRDVTFDQAVKHVDKMESSAFGSVGKLLRFRLVDLRRAYTLREMEALLAQVPFGATRIDGTALGIEVWFQR